MRDVGLQGVGGGLGRLAAPQELGQSVCRHHLVGVHDERSQQQPRLAAGQVDRVALYHDLKRPEDPNLHIAPSMLQRSSSVLQARCGCSREDAQSGQEGTQEMITDPRPSDAGQTAARSSARDDRDIYRLAPSMDAAVLETIAARLEFRGTDEGYARLSQTYLTQPPAP